MIRAGANAGSCADIEGVRALVTVILLVSILLQKSLGLQSSHLADLRRIIRLPPAIFALAMARGSVFAATGSAAVQVAGFNLAKEPSGEDFCLLLNLREIKHVDKRRR